MQLGHRIDGHTLVERSAIFEVIEDVVLMREIQQHAGAAPPQIGIDQQDLAAFRRARPRKAHRRGRFALARQCRGNGDGPRPRPRRQGEEGADGTEGLGEQRMRMRQHVIVRRLDRFVAHDSRRQGRNRACVAQMQAPLDVALRLDAAPQIFRHENGEKRCDERQHAPCRRDERIIRA